MIDDSLDFHNLGPTEPNQVRYYFDNFIDESYAQGNKHLLIITGKGESTKSTRGMVYKIVQKLLSTNRLIIKYRQAEEHLGGSGAFEVWLKD